jgi:competence protein ComGF
LFFDINAKIEEQKKENNQVTLAFTLLISTKPNVVKYSTSGTVTMSGKPDDIKKKLEVNPKTKIPQILFTIYQHVFGLF